MAMGEMGQSHIYIKKLESFTVSGRMSGETPAPGVIGLTEKEQTSTKVGTIRERDFVLIFHFNLDTFKILPPFWEKKKQTPSFYDSPPKPTARRRDGYKTYLGIVGYIMLGQCLRSVHPCFI